MVDDPLEARSDRGIAARFPFFYGWIILPITAISLIATCPGQTTIIGFFTESFERALGLSVERISWLYLWATVLAAPAVLIVGAVMDRIGVRITLAVICTFLGGACFIASRINGPFGLFVAMVLLRSFGHGSAPLLAENALAMWFHTRLGTATGLKNFGAAAGLSVMPVLASWAIHHFGWRSAFAILGVMVWVSMLPLLAIFFRNRPEEVGQRPDGRAAPRSSTSDAAAANLKVQTELPDSLTLSSAMRTRTYWIMAILNFFRGTAWAGVAFHFVRIFKIGGLTEQHAAVSLSVMLVCMAVTPLIAGVLADRFRLNVLMSAACAMVGAGLVLAIYVGPMWTVSGFVIVYALGQGLADVAANTAWPRYFGLRHLGKIRGTATAGLVAGSSIGPYLMGVVYDRCGDFDVALWILTGIYGALTVATLLATPPRSQPKESVGPTEKG
jgi:MFS family permease